MNSEALAAFQLLHERTKGEGPIFAAERGTATVESDGDIKRLRAALRGTRHWFEDAVTEAKIEHFTWHCLRHTFASRLVMAGVDLRIVADLLGHLNIQMTMRYVHLAQGHKAAAVEKLSAFKCDGKKAARNCYTVPRWTGKTNCHHYRHRSKKCSGSSGWK